MIKVNFDGSMTSYAATAVYFIRDQYTSFIQTRGKLLTQALVSFVELIAIWLGVCVVISDLNATPILLEKDSAIVVSWLNVVNISHKSNNSFMQDIAI